MTATEQAPLRQLHRYLFPERYGRDAMMTHPRIGAADPDEMPGAYSWTADTIDDTARLLESLMRDNGLGVPAPVEYWRNA